MSNRDDFTEATKEAIAQRAGYQCSNPTCRRGTYMPNPVNPSKAINQGVAAHIRAASPGGPRYDESMTQEARKAVDNGIWLCQSCAKVIDSAPDAYPVETLLAWKKYAEASAARGARSSSDIVGDLINRIESAQSTAKEFFSKWADNEPRSWPRTKTFEEETLDLLSILEHFKRHTLRILHRS